MKINIKKSSSSIYRLVLTRTGRVRRKLCFYSSMSVLDRKKLTFTHNKEWIVLFMMFVSPFICLSQNLDAVIAKADTSGFRSNNNGGWALYNSYISRGPDDSVTFEVIVQHNKTGINWTSKQYIGKIKSQNLLPSSDKIISYAFPGFEDNFTITISNDGKCYLSLSDGSLPPDDPVVIYVRVKY